MGNDTKELTVFVRHHFETDLTGQPGIRQICQGVVGYRVSQYMPIHHVAVRATLVVEAELGAKSNL